MFVLLSHLFCHKEQRAWPNVCYLLLFMIFIIFTSNVKKIIFFLLQQDFSRPTSKDESLKFFAADVTLEAAALSLKIGFSKAELAATAAGAAVVDEAVDLLRI